MSPGGDVNRVWNITAGDLNGDGLEDVVVSGWTFDQAAAYVYLFMQNPDGSLSDRTQALLADNVIEGNQRTLIEDFDGDGHVDVFLPGFRDGSVVVSADSVMLWGGPAGFTRENFSDQVQAHGACVADLNNDGRPDMLVAGDAVALTGGAYINNGDRTFTVMPNVLPNSNVYFEACAVIPFAGGHTVYLSGNNNGNSPRDNIAVIDHALAVTSVTGHQTDPSLDTTDVLATDLDEDGAVDFVTIANGLGVGDPGPVQLMEADGNGLFATTTLLGTLRSQYHGRALTIEGRNAVYISGDSNEAAVFKGLTRYRPDSFKAMAGTTMSFMPTGLYRNGNTGAVHIIELLDNTFYTAPL